MLLVKNGHVVDPVTGIDEACDILIDGSLIKAVVKVSEGGITVPAFCSALQGTDTSGAEDEPGGGMKPDVIDASQLIVAPGLMDAHVHFRDPGFTEKEDIFTGTMAAARGGFTTVVCMANTSPAVDSLPVLQTIQKRAEKTGIHVLQTSTVTKGLKGKALVDMDEMAQAGAAGFTDDGIPIMDEGLLLKAMEKAYELDMPISLHEEDPLFINGAGVNAGRAAERIGYGGADRTAENILVARDCMLALHTGAPVCIQHISTAEAVSLVRLTKKMGADIHAEATPHHFTLTEDAVPEYMTLARMNPPLRTEADRSAIIEGIKDGTIDMIVTDHAPHTREEKNRPIDKAPSGITGLETSLALGIKSLVMPGYISLMRLIELMSKGPAEFYRMTVKGICAGAPADLVIFGENEKWIYDRTLSKAGNTPFKGWELPGKIHYTICSGRIVYDEAADYCYSSFDQPE